MMTKCTTCRIGGQRLTDDEWRALHHAHVSAGIRYVSCPVCGGQRWPWELPAPDLGGATGIQWWIRGRVWSLDYNEDLRGVVISFRGRSESWIQTTHGDELVTRGTLADCARALVDAVRKDEPQHGPDWRVTDGRRA